MHAKDALLSITNWVIKTDLIYRRIKIYINIKSF